LPLPVCADRLFFHNKSHLAPSMLRLILPIRLRITLPICVTIWQDCHCCD
jgi:hypothetical protein